MQLKTLEFAKILERLAKYAMFSASKELVLALEPTPFYSEAATRQIETSEAVELLAVKMNVTVGGARDVRPFAERAQRGVILMVDELISIQQTLIAARELQRIIIKLESDYPRLADIAQRIEPCPGVINQISQVIDERGEIRDSASTNLARIRRELEVVHGRLMEKLNRLVTSAAPYLQDAIITQRAGRYVVPVKAEFKGRVQGIVHDQSGSGMTLFIEPMVTVELNNQWRQLQLDETEEIRKILAELSLLVSDHSAAIKHTVSALADLDLAFAKAKYALAIKASAPTLVDWLPEARHTLKEQDDRPFFQITGARHPLLDPKTAVPIDVKLLNNTHILVITGPNTGGKTVSLKTIGLMALMAQAGLWLPAIEARLPVFNHILADIGDEQSIEQSLSTFSGHMTNIVQILNRCDDHSMVIFDELGAGTDPIEGSALAQAILGHLLEQQVTTFVATHYSELKAYAHTTLGVVNASMEFDLDSLRPTYRLLMGLAGASNAFSIAQRLGLSDPIIQRAQGLVGAESQQIEAMLGEIRAEMASAQQLRQQAEQQTVELQSRLAEVDKERKDILSSAREDARREIKAAREQIRALQQQAEAALAEAQTRSAVQVEDQPVENMAQIDQQLETLSNRLQPKPQLPQVKKLPPMIGPGDTVFIPQYNMEGEVIALQRKQAEVQLGHFRMTVPLTNLELRKKGSHKTIAQVEQSVRMPEAESPGMELDLRGQVTEDALQALDAYLDKAYLARLLWVRIIHGKGSGVLRQVVRQTLNTHALVSSYTTGELGEGGDGVTVAKLAVS